jgi:uncharacterized protein Usg
MAVGQVRDHRDIELVLKGYRLATAEILYRMPDNQHFLQSFLWQDFDMAPEFPVLRKFLRFWEENLDGPLHSVRVASTQLLTPAEDRAVDGIIRIH